MSLIKLRSLSENNYIKNGKRIFTLKNLIYELGILNFM